MTHVPAGELNSNQVLIWDRELKNELTSSPTKVSWLIATSMTLICMLSHRIELLRRKFLLHIHHDVNGRCLLAYVFCPALGRVLCGLTQVEYRVTTPPWLASKRSHNGDILWVLDSPLDDWNCPLGWKSQPWKNKSAVACLCIRALFK